MSVSILLGLVGITSVFILKKRGPSGIWEGAMKSLLLLKAVVRMLVLGMMLAAMAQVILPTELITAWMGERSGLTGILLGTAVGVLVPGGPYVVIPLAASVFLAGAGVGPVAALLTAYHTIPLTRTVIWELPFLGGAFTTSRIIVNAPFPIIAGLAAPPIYRMLI